MDSHLEVIDAFVDGERVDAASLKSALADADGRDYFVDAWTLREAVQQDPAMTGADRRAAVVPPRRATGWWMVAAALVAGIAGGYAAGYRSLTATPAPIVEPPTTTALARPETRGVVPTARPTRVIQLEFHPDTNGGGGN